MKKVVLILAFSLCPNLFFGQISLEYRLDQGDTFTIKQKAEQIITQKLDGASHEITNKIDGVMEFIVLGNTGDNYELNITFKDLNLSMHSSIQGELLNVNAKEVKEGDIQSNIFNSLLNVPIQMILSRNGDIIEVNGGDSLVSKMAKSSGLQDEFSLNMMKKSLEKEFGSRALSDSYKQMTFIYPDHEINVGDRWENQYSGKLNAKNTWTLDEVTGENAKISGKAEVEMNLSEPATTMELNGTQTTSVNTDIVTGFIEKMTVNGMFEGFSTLTQLGDQEIPTTIKSTITYELVDSTGTEVIKN